MVMETYLVEGEEILAQAGSFYASNKRLLRYKKHLKGEELDDIPYSHITSIGIVRNTRRGLIKAGTIIAIIGVSTLLTLIAVKPVLKSTSDLWSNAAGNLAIQGIPFTGLDLVSLLAPLIPFSIVILALGVLLIGLGVFLPQVFIQFRTPGLTSDTEAKFRLAGVRKEASLNLVRTVRQQSMAKESALTNVRPNQALVSAGLPGVGNSGPQGDRCRLRASYCHNSAPQEKRKAMVPQV